MSSRKIDCVRIAGAVREILLAIGEDPEREGLIKYESYSGATLTSSGKKMARELMQKHRVIADLLEILGIDRERAETDACEIEHHVSPETLKRLEQFVEFARNDPVTTKSLSRFRSTHP